MDIWTIIFFVGGLIGLVGGAELLVKGAARLAARTGLSPIVIGLTVVAFGTSAPELAVSMGAALRGDADLAVGNIVGSNIANILLVLGVSAVVGGGLLVASRIVRIDVPIMIGLSLLLFAFGYDNQLARWEGAVFVVLLITYIVWTVVSSRRDGAASAETEFADELSDEQLATTSAMADAGWLILGIALLVVGSAGLVEAATDMAEALGVSQLVIGLTVVAVGTSLPELATSVIAVVRGQRDLACGNAIGSNLFNIMAVLGLTAVVAPSSIPIPDAALALDLPVMIAVAIACLPIFANGHVLNRWEGIMFLGYYAAYVGWLILESGEHSIRDTYAVAILGFVIPLSVITLGVIAYRDRRTRQITV